MNVRWGLWVGLLVCAPLAANTVRAGGWRVTELRLNTPTMEGQWYASASPLARGLGIRAGYMALYTIEVLPGLQYTLQLRVPRAAERVRVYAYDRWPLSAGARRFALPSGPVTWPPRARRITYRWRIGISPRSTGTLLYLMVWFPRPWPAGPVTAPVLLVRSPPIVPTHRIGRGITYLDGPRDLLLSGESGAVSYTLLPAAPAVPVRSARVWTAPRDLVINGRFSAGLRGWVPRTGADGRGLEPTVGSQGLRLAPGTGVRSQLDADVARARALVLWADVRLGRATSGDGGRTTGDPGLTIALCLRDEAGRRHCGRHSDRIEFFRQGKGNAATAAAAGRIRRLIPAGTWYRFQIDLAGGPSHPAHIDSIDLSAGTAGTAWVREVHLIRGGTSDAGD